MKLSILSYSKLSPAFKIKLVVALFASASFSEAANQCVSHYLNDKSFTVQRIANQKYAETFLMSKINENYEVKMVSDLSPIMNQKNWGFCHLYSFYTEITREYKQRNNGQDPNISIHYMAFQHWLGRSIDTALNPGSNLKPQEGGWYIYDIELFKKIGVMSNDEYARIGGKTDVEERLNKFLEDTIMTKTISNLHDQQNMLNEIFKSDFSDKEIQALTKDLPSSASTSSRLALAKRNYMQSLFEGKEFRRVDEFKAFVKAKEKALEQGKTNLTSEQLAVLKDLSNGRVQISQMTPSHIEKIKSNLRLDVKDQMTELFASFFFGKQAPPAEAMNLDKNLALAKSMFPEIKQATISISVDEDNIRAGKGVSMESRPDFVKKHVYLKASLPDLYELIADNVERQNNGVWIGYDHNDPYVANKIGEQNLGLMSLKAFDWTPDSPYMSRYQRFVQKQIYNGGHAVQIVGVIREKVPAFMEKLGMKGKITGFVIQNSWGPEAGQNGFYIMDVSYANAFLFGITIRDENGEFAKLQEAYKKQAAKNLNSSAEKEVSNFNIYVEKEKKIKEATQQ